MGNRLMAVRILLVDDHALVRQGLRSLLAAIDGFEVVGEAVNGREALGAIRALAPDIVLMDVAMPELNGLDATARAVRAHPGLKVIVVSMHATEAYVLEALRAGAVGYILKDADASDLERAIRAVSNGQQYLTPAVSHHVIARFMKAERGDIVDAPDALTPRQREVLQLIAEGSTTRDIAARLHISVKTVESHRSQLMQRLDIFEVAGLTRYALRHRLIDSER